MQQLNRRQFLRNGGVAIAAGGIAPATASA